MWERVVRDGSADAVAWGDEDLVPPVVWAFPLSLSLKSPDERTGQ